MTSAIDATKPAEGKAYTADQRANWAAAKSEIENLQQLTQSLEISVFNFMTAAQVADVKAGVLSFNAATAIQAAIDAANAISTVATARNAVRVTIPAGKYDVRTQILVKTRVDIVGDGILYNSMASTTDFLFWFKNGSQCSKITVDANSKSGILFGESGVTCDMRIENVRVLSAGVAANQVGVRVWGAKFTIGSINVDGGRPGIDFGDGGTNVCYSANARVLRTSSAYSGIRFDKCEYISVSQLIIDSSTNDGLVIDRSHEIFIAEASLFFNDAAAGTCFASGYAIDIGQNSVATKCMGITINAMIDNTGGAMCRLAYSDRHNLRFHGHRGTLYSGNAHNVMAAVVYGAGLGTLGFVEIFGFTGIYSSGSVVTSEIFHRDTFIDYNVPLSAPSLIVTNVGTFLGELKATSAVDQSINNAGTGTTLVNLTDLKIPVGANENWEIEGILDIGAALATTGVKLAVTVPAGATIDVSCALIPDIITAGNRCIRRTTTGGAALDFTAATEVGVGDAQIRFFIRINNGATPGDVQLQGAQSTASATNITFRALSYIWGTKIA